MNMKLPADKPAWFFRQTSCSTITSPNMSITDDCSLHPGWAEVDGGLGEGWGARLGHLVRAAPSVGGVLWWPQPPPVRSVLDRLVSGQVTDD